MRRAPGLAIAWGISIAIAGVAAIHAARANDESATRYFDVEYIPTPQAIVDSMLDMARVGPGDFVIDLGSGDGRIPITAAKEKGARALGVELDKRLLGLSRANAAAAGVADRVEFREQDLFETDLSEASVLTLYLLPKLNLRLRPRILEQMRSGARVVSHQFTMEDWEPDETANWQWRQAYLWIVPARVAGRWRVEAPDGAFEIELWQSFQKIDGTATAGGRRTQLLEATLSGDAIAFTVDDGAGGRKVYAGRVAGAAMEGARWRATRP